MKNDSKYNKIAVVEGTISSLINYQSLSEPALEQITKLKGKVYSVTELEDYAKCPYMYFAKRILRFGQEDEEETTLKPLEKGNLLHTVLFKFYTILKLEQTSSDFEETSSDFEETSSDFEKSSSDFEKSSSDFKDQQNDNTLSSLKKVELKAGNRDKYIELLHNLAHEELKMIKYDSVLFAVDELFLFGTNNSKGILEKWLDNELARIKNGWKHLPVLFETSFGGHNDAFGAVKLNDNVHLKGKIDRIEVLELGDGTLEVIIADYKLSQSTSLATNARVEEGNSFQMPLYMLVVEQIMEQYYDKKVKFAGAAYYIIDTKYSDKSTKVILTHKTADLPVEFTKRGAYKTYEALETALETSLRSAEAVIMNIEAGNFPVKPVNKATCEHCAFKPACRIGEKVY